MLFEKTTSTEPRAGGLEARPTVERGRSGRSDIYVSDGVAGAVAELLGRPEFAAVRAYDGSYAGTTDPECTITVTSPDAFTRVITAPGELGLARAYVAGDLEIEGDILAFVERRHEIADPRENARALLGIARLAWKQGAPRRLLPPPPEEARLRGRMHSKRRDAAAIAHHYDVGNDFYRLVLGPTMTYSCAVWTDPSVGLDAAQEAKYELICRKLGLRPGRRLLDVGCGWGGMVLHAAREHGVEAVGVTISEAQAELARARVDAAGCGDRVRIVVRDYRDVDDGPYDAISSIGMFEHVGQGRLTEYSTKLAGLLRPEGRLLNHGISRSPGRPARVPSRGFMGRYVFPDGELVEVGQTVSAVQRAGLEVRHEENLREHYALTLRAWLANLEANWDEAVRLVGAARARIWRLYIAGCAAGFDEGTTQIHQVLAVKSTGGRSGMPLRPQFG